MVLLRKYWSSSTKQLKPNSCLVVARKGKVLSIERSYVTVNKFLKCCFLTPIFDTYISLTLFTLRVKV